MSTEVWKDIAGFEGLYQISNLGNVLSLGNGNSNCSKRKILKPSMLRSGYMMVVLYKDGKKQRSTVHRLVGMAFLSNPFNKPMINHDSGIKSENEVTNLEWSTRSENAKHAVAIGLMKSGKDHSSSKAVIQRDIKGNYIKEWGAIKQIKREVNYLCSNIRRCCNGQSKTAYGFVWEYKLV